MSQSLLMGTMSIGHALAFAPNFQKGMVAAAKIFNLLKRQPKIVDPVNPAIEKWVCRTSNILLYVLHYIVIFSTLSSIKNFLLQTYII